LSLILLAGLVLLSGLVLGALIALRRLARRALLHRLLLGLPATLARAALWRLPFLSRRAALALRTRGCAGLSAALHALGGCQAYARQQHGGADK
jgi:hypothetical protein